MNDLKQILNRTEPFNAELRSVGSAQAMPLLRKAITVYGAEPFKTELRSVGSA